MNIAIAIRDTGLFLMATVVRAHTSDVYVNWPRPHKPDWKPHASYHASGQHHQKSFGKAHGIQHKQKPDAHFKASKAVVSFGVATGEHKAVNVPCDSSAFNAVFELPSALVRPETYRTYVYVDLVEPGHEPIFFPQATILKQATYMDAVPWIVLTFLDINL
jgi:hypothetical protein